MYGEIEFVAKGGGLHHTIAGDSQASFPPSPLSPCLVYQRNHHGWSRQDHFSALCSPAGSIRLSVFVDHIRVTYGRRGFLQWPVRLHDMARVVTELGFLSYYRQFDTTNYL